MLIKQDHSADRSSLIEILAGSAPVIMACLFLLTGISFRSFSQKPAQSPPDTLLDVGFVIPEIREKPGELSFNVVKVFNSSEKDVRVKPVLLVPEGWSVFPPVFPDTLVGSKEELLLSFRVRIPQTASSKDKHIIRFQAFSEANLLIVEQSLPVFPETVRNWDVFPPEERVVFYPRKNLASFNIRVVNNGNTNETIRIKLDADKKIALRSLFDWEFGEEVGLEPFQDTILTFSATYNYSDSRSFDMSRIQINASTDERAVIKAVVIEKYSDVFAPFEIDRSLPHMAAAGVRTFSRNEEFLPFIKARGRAEFKNKDAFEYNFNYYDLAQNENLISNSYYSFLYKRKQLELGLGAFSSELGRNLYSRHAIIASNVFEINSLLSIKGFFAQSFLTPKTSFAAGYYITNKKLNIQGSFAYDLDGERKVNTASAFFRSNAIQIAKNHEININLYGLDEFNYYGKEYRLTGFAWDLMYFGKIGKVMSLRLMHNFGTPDIPGPQMGLNSLSIETRFFLRKKRSYISIDFYNGSRNYYTYNFEGDRLPNIELYDQYGGIFFNSRGNSRHSYRIGPSIEFYNSLTPSRDFQGLYIDFRSQNLRLEYGSVIASRLSIDIKTGIQKISIREIDLLEETRYDFHFMGAYSFEGGISVVANYDYGPMINSGLYQFPGDALNHSFNIGPQVMATFLKNRVAFNMFTSLNYRFDLEYGFFTVNPKLEAFLFKDWYAEMSGTYTYSRQEYQELILNNSHYYLEFAIKKRWGKTDYTKWQKDTRRLKLVYFKDENGNGIKDGYEEGVPHVKTRITLESTADQEVMMKFPVDITLLSNDEGIVIFNRLPVGFYSLKVTPLGDVREYFYVDKGAQQLELSKTTTVYVPFQKAERIDGIINVRRQKFIKEGEEGIDLANIKVTAYNNKGNSYSSFSRPDGRFVIYVPGDASYAVRMNNPFGSNFTVMDNDQTITIPGSQGRQIVFNVAERSRQISFKKAKPAADSLEPGPLKLKVLHGKIYENRPEEGVRKDAIPQFDMGFGPPEEVNIQAGYHYVVLGTAPAREEALRYYQVFRENGIKTRIGYYQADKTFYVFTNSFPTRGEAADEQKQLKDKGYKEQVDIIRF